MLINFLLSTMLKIFCNKALEPNSTEKKKKKKQKLKQETVKVITTS